jgi:hypothetical protein
LSGLSDAATSVTAVTAVTAVAGGYVQFVLKRSVLPSAQFDIQFTPYVRGESQLVGEVELVFKNVGSTMLVVTGVRSRVRYRLKNDPEMRALNDIAEPAFPSKVLPDPTLAAGGQLSSSLPSSPPSAASRVPVASPHAPAAGREFQAAAAAAHPGWLGLVQERTFIQPGVTQCYRKPIALPADTQLVHIWGAFDYHIDMGPVTRFLVKWLATPPKDLDWRRGIDNHTARRTFLIPAVLPA